MFQGEKQVIEFQVEVNIEPDDDGFHAYCPALKGLHTRGNTEQEAVDNARDAAIAYIESCIRHGDPIPIGLQVRRERKQTHQSGIRAVNRRVEDLQVACAIS
jgi:predicted RNase H-like HicB family nuclease